MSKWHDWRRIIPPHQRTNGDGRSFQRSVLRHKLVDGDLVGKEPVDAGKAEAKKAGAKQCDEEGHLQDVEQVDHGAPRDFLRVWRS